MRRHLAALAAAGAALGLLPGTPALAGGGLPLVLAAANALCIHPNGPYRQVTLDSDGECGSFIFTVVGTTSQGWHLELITDGNGHCLTANRAGTIAVVKPRACRSSEWWIDRLVPPTQGANDSLTWGKSDDQLGTLTASPGVGVVTADSPPWRIWSEP